MVSTHFKKTQNQEQNSLAISFFYFALLVLQLLVSLVPPYSARAGRWPHGRGLARAAVEAAAALAPSASRHTYLLEERGGVYTHEQHRRNITRRIE